MSPLASISENLDALWSLSKKDVIFLDDLPRMFTRAIFKLSLPVKHFI